MKTANVLLLAGAAFVAWEAFHAVEAVNDINVVFSGVDIKNLNNIVVKIIVQNVTNTGITVNSMTGNLFLDGNQIASLSDFTPRDVVPNGQTEIDVTVSPSWLSLPGNIMSLISQTGNILNFEAVGHVNVAGLPVLPFDLPQTVAI